MLQGLGLEEVKKELVLQLSIVLLVVAALNNSYNASQPRLVGLMIM